MVMDASETLDQEPQKTSMLPSGPVSPLSNHCLTLLTPLTFTFLTLSCSPRTLRTKLLLLTSQSSPGIPEKGPLLYPQEYSQFNICWGEKKQIKVRLVEQDIFIGIMKKFILSNWKAKGLIKGDITIFLFNLILWYYNEITCAIYPKESFVLICL